jgi:hypothetical protein
VRFGRGRGSNGTTITVEFFTWFLSVVMFGAFRSGQMVSGLKVVLYPIDPWSASYVNDASLDSIDFMAARDTASGLSRRICLSMEVGASGTTHRGNTFRSYAAFHFDMFFPG